METRKVKSGEDPRTYVDVFSRLGSPPPRPPRRRFEKLMAELRRRAVVVGRRMRERGIALADHARARASAALARGREERLWLAARARETRVVLARRAAEKRLELLDRGREMSGALVRRVREERVILMRGVGERSAALVRRLREEGTTLARRAREKKAALRQALGEERTALAARLQEGRVAFVRRVRGWAAASPQWRFEWHRSGPRALPRQPSMFVGLACFVFAFVVAWWTGGPTDDVPERKTVFVVEQAVSPPVSAPSPSPAATQPAVLDVGQALRTPGVSEAAQLAVVDELTKDPSDVATSALLAGVDADSLHVSMACLRALSGRSCEAVAAALANRLDDALWQRRAWAARVLGSNECAGAGRHLSQRLAVESDERVQAQLKIAINSLKEPGA